MSAMRELSTDPTPDPGSTPPAEPGLGVLSVFVIPLPEYVPIPHGTVWTKELDVEVPELADFEFAIAPDGPTRAGGKNYVSLKFWQVIDEPGPTIHTQRLAAKVVDQLTGQPSAEPQGGPPRPSGLENCLTVVEAVTYVPVDGSTSDALTNCVEAIIDFHLAYRIAENARLPELTYERLPSLVLELERSAPDFGAAEAARVHVLAHANVQGVSPVDRDVDADTIHRISQVVVRLERRDPFMRFAARRADARVEAHTNGRYGESIIQTAIAAEILFDAILGLTLWEESLTGAMTPAQAAEMFSTDLSPRLKTHYAPRLGGQWALNGPNLSGWFRDIAGVRSRVVHAGYRATLAEAQAATVALVELERFIGDRLADRWRKYPRTAWMFLGGPGFTRRGKARAALAWADTLLRPLQVEIGEWSEAYGLWREQVNADVQRRRAL